MTVHEFSVNTQQSTVNTQQSTLNSQHSTVNTQQSTVNSQHSTVNSQHSTVNTQRLECGIIYFLEFPYSSAYICHLCQARARAIGDAARTERVLTFVQNTLLVFWRLTPEFCFDK
ncbi:hypothetical protein LC613_21710 [Nostoc sphaeroides CHAB 2801]|uniref:hypothetical protein n=1 Tax=Nostoc sphaeroides TaxID=446679 RepID=UPI0015F32ADF|nr:hypothetical protein [Nostoc sphaeroides]MCC5630478.1 hypothetical protein [Nostoc sphaeroides CHAB 2801]